MTEKSIESEAMKGLVERVAAAQSTVAALLDEIQHIQVTHPAAPIHQNIGISQICEALEKASHVLGDASIHASVLYLSTL